MVGVLPSRPATSSMAARKLRLAWAALSKLSSSLSAIAARTVHAQVRKSFAVISLPVISFRYSFTSVDVTSWQFPASPTYCSNSCPGRSWHAFMILATRRSLTRNDQSWILEPSATDLCEPDLHVFAKLFEDRLERGLEAQALSGREIGGDDDVLDFFVGHLVDVDLARQPAA